MESKNQKSSNRNGPENPVVRNNPEVVGFKNNNALRWKLVRAKAKRKPRLFEQLGSDIS